VQDEINETCRVHKKMRIAYKTFDRNISKKINKLVVDGRIITE
jgi:hypothetical protein